MTFRHLCATGGWISLLAIAGCGSNPGYVQEGPTMTEIYDQQMAADSAVAGPAWRGGARAVGAADADLSGYTRDAAHELDALFRELPNPKLVMYIFPHPTGEGVHVPGYSVSFPLYRRTEYALPGEVTP